MQVVLFILLLVVCGLLGYLIIKTPTKGKDYEIDKISDEIEQQLVDDILNSYIEDNTKMSDAVIQDITIPPEELTEYRNAVEAYIEEAKKSEDITIQNFKWLDETHFALTIFHNISREGSLSVVCRHDVFKAYFDMKTNAVVALEYKVAF